VPGNNNESQASLDAFLGGKIKLYQPKEGYRFSIDSILLADFVKCTAHDKIVDLGSGCGIIPLILHYNRTFHSVLGIEIQEELAALARRNVHLNKADKKIQIVSEDFRRFAASYDGEKFDIAVSNPPYRKLHSGRLNPEHGKAIARHEISCTLEELVYATAKLLDIKGQFYYIYPAFRLSEMLALLLKHHLSANKLCFIHPQADGEATHFLVQGGFTSPVNLKILPPISIFNPDGSYANNIKEILQKK
jgi:tRNA1Val (adenine37-N6)-methyltransferase